jgi:acetyl esterase/lipase
MVCLLTVALLVWPVACGTGLGSAPDTEAPDPWTAPVLPHGCWEQMRTRQIFRLSEFAASRPRPIELPPEPIRILTGIAYGPHTCQQLDLYLPGTPHFPVVVFVHGGSWIGEDKSDCKIVGQYLAAHGIGACVINYRQPPETNVAGEVQDVARATVWTRQHIATYGGLSEQLFLAGHSAGAHLVAVLVTDLPGDSLPPGSLRGVIALEGTYRINFLVALWGVAYAFEGVDFRAMSPAQRIRPGLPPFLLIVAEHGPKYMNRQARLFHRQLLEQGCSAELFVAPGQRHYDLTFGIAAPGALQGPCMLEFIHRLTP